jgi:hypothetical protein
VSHPRTTWADPTKGAGAEHPAGSHLETRVMATDRGLSAEG